MPTSLVSVQERWEMYTLACCTYATCALLVYDWLLCFSQELRFIWRWHSNVTGFLLVYAFSRYAVFIQVVLAMASNFLSSDRSCRAVAWTQNITWVLGTIAYAAFPALRAYALSNRNKWLSAIIILLALPPGAMSILKAFNETVTALPSPINCTSSNLLSPALTTRSSFPVVPSFGEHHRLAQSCWSSVSPGGTPTSRIAFGKESNSEKVLVLSSSTTEAYFSCTHYSLGPVVPETHSKLHRFFAALYIIDIIFRTAPVPENILHADAFLGQFFDPMTSILTCRFMLSIRQFDSNVLSSTDSGMGSRLEGRTTLVNVLQFAAQPSDSLPPFIASFAHPVHVESALYGTDPDGLVDDGSEWRELDVVAPTENLEDAIVPESSTTRSGRPA